MQPHEHLSSDLLHYADDPPGHAGLSSHHVQESKLQPDLAAQYRSMNGLKYRSTSDGRCWSTEECLRSTVESECRSTRLVSGSTVADKNRATNKCCLSIDEERISLRIESVFKLDKIKSIRQSKFPGNGA